MKFYKKKVNKESQWTKMFRCFKIINKIDKFLTKLLTEKKDATYNYLEFKEGTWPTDSNKY